MALWLKRTTPWEKKLLSSTMLCSERVATCGLDHRPLWSTTSMNLSQRAHSRHTKVFFGVKYNSLASQNKGKFFGSSYASLDFDLILRRMFFTIFHVKYFQKNFYNLIKKTENFFTFEHIVFVHLF